MSHGRRVSLVRNRGHSTRKDLTGKQYTVRVITKAHASSWAFVCLADRWVGCDLEVRGAKARNLHFKATEIGVQIFADAIGDVDF